MLDILRKKGMLSLSVFFMCGLAMFIFWIIILIVCLYLEWYKPAGNSIVIINIGILSAFTFIYLIWANLHTFKVAIYFNDLNYAKWKQTYFKLKPWYKKIFIIFNILLFEIFITAFVNLIKKDTK